MGEILKIPNIKYFALIPPVILMAWNAPLAQARESNFHYSSREITSQLSTYEDLVSQLEWVDFQGIRVILVHTKVSQMYDHGFNPNTDTIPLTYIEGLENVFQTLQLLPDNVLLLIKGKTIYISTAYDRPYSVLKGNYQNVLQNVDEGIIIPQPLSGYRVVHEIGHLLGYHGIEGLYENSYPSFRKVQNEYDRIFDTTENYDYPSKPPTGYISVYATGNKAEDFAEHFAYYVTRGEEFRQKAKNDQKLSEKYEFFKKHIFNGEEY